MEMEPVITPKINVAINFGNESDMDKGDDEVESDASGEAESNASDMAESSSESESSSDSDSEDDSDGTSSAGSYKVELVDDGDGPKLEITLPSK